LRWIPTGSPIYFKAMPPWRSTWEFAMKSGSRETSEHYARLFVQLKRAGSPVPDNDLLLRG
jgi:hypothetical protein